MRTDSTVRSQDLETYYRLNGAIYCYKVDSIIKNNGINYDNNVHAYVMEQIKSIDIDTHLDFKIASAIANE